MEHLTNENEAHRWKSRYPDSRAKGNEKNRKRRVADAKSGPDVNLYRLRKKPLRSLGRSIEKN